MAATPHRWAAVRGLTLALLAGVVSASPAVAGPVRVDDHKVLQQVDFERHIMGLLGRLGCNAGACHGSFQGKGGFRLSLFGYDPERDYLALTRAGLGRRINPVNPDRSLLLLKATGQVVHGGGRRFARGSWPYQAFRAWIAAGAVRHKGSGTVTAMTLAPEEYARLPLHQTGQVRARVRFADGSEEDVTPLCDCRVQDDAVAEVVGAGRIKALRPGDTALVVSYRGHVWALRVLAPVPAASGFRYPQVPEVNYIDREVFAKLRRLNVVPSALASDAEFLRRVTIDTIGCLPTPPEVRAFLADRRPDKRARKIEQLLAHPLHAALLLPQLDQTLAALVGDLDERGLLERTIVYCAGEFGRTPRVNGNAGRDHWARSMAVVLAGGGFRRGYAHGSTDAQGMAPATEACTPEDVSATLFHCLGIDPHRELMTPTGRPLQLFRDGKVIDKMLT